MYSHTHAPLFYSRSELITFDFDFVHWCMDIKIYHLIQFCIASSELFSQFLIVEKIANVFSTRDTNW